MFRLSINKQKAISLLSLTFLLFVQYRLIYNTYELKNNQYEIEEKKILNEAYGQSIRNDKVFPGGQSIIDSILYRNMYTLETLYMQDITLYEEKRDLVCDSIFRRLRLFSNMDSVFSSIVNSHHIEDLRYLLLVEGISVTFDGKSYIPLYQAGDLLASETFYTDQGIIIDGNLAHINKQNQITHLTVSATSDHSYFITFSLYADRDNRILTIIKAMLPTFFMSILSIALVISIYYSTYRNWLKQKKLADMKSDFLNSITHEFNTPISTIMVANKSLQNKEIIANPQNILALTEVIKRQAERLHALINQALSISVMDKSIAEKEKFELNALLEELINDYRLKITEQVGLNFRSAVESFHIALNRFLFTTMLYNIFDNALKYNTSTFKEINVNMVTEGPYIVINIQDNGIGMNKDMTSNIFDKFYRGKNNLRAAGLGLGLFYVKQTLEAHGWRLDLSSNLGFGSTFRIFIPSRANQH